MKLFHVLMGGAEHRALRLFDDHSLNLLIAASMLTFERRWRKHKGLIRKKAKLLFADSGVLGWIKKLGEGAFEYIFQPDKVLDLQLQIDPDIIAHVDIPCEPQILKQLGTNRPTALAQTFYNAEWLVNRAEKDERLKDKKLALVVQGYTLKEYEKSIQNFEIAGFFSLDPEKYWFAIGSVCMRKPPELYEVVKFVRDAIPDRYHVHCFGIASPPWILRLKDFGVNSVDSATGSVLAGYFRFVDKGGKRRRLEIEKKNKYMFAAMVAFNWASLEAQIENSEAPVYSLFDVLEVRGGGKEE